MRDEIAAAVSAYRKASNSSNTEHAISAIMGLGLLLDEQGDAEGAEKAFRKVIESGHAVQGPLAAIGLGSC